MWAKDTIFGGYRRKNKLPYSFFKWQNILSKRKFVSWMKGLEMSIERQRDSSNGMEVSETYFNPNILMILWEDPRVTLKRARRSWAPTGFSPPNKKTKNSKENILTLSFQQVSAWLPLSLDAEAENQQEQCASHLKNSSLVRAISWYKGRETGKESSQYMFQHVELWSAQSTFVQIRQSFSGWFC